MRREQMRKVAEDACILHMVDTLDWTYEDHVRNWKAKYGKDGKMTPIQDLQEDIARSAVDIVD